MVCHGTGLAPFILAQCARFKACAMVLGVVLCTLIAVINCVFLKVQTANEANQSGYDELRKAVKEHWVTMKEYYKGALDAFIKRDYDNAERLMEQGNFYMRKAREADELSAQKLIEDNDEEELSLNMLIFEPKEAVQNLKPPLTYFSGVPTIRHLKIIVGTGDANKKDVRRKRLITSLLKKEGIPWIEEGNGWVISLEANKIDPRKLSFATD